MSNILEQDRRQPGHYLVRELGMISRDEGVIASGSGALKAGAVLGKVTASQKHVPLNPSANDGSEVAAALLFESCDATSSDQVRTLTTRLAEVHADALQWPDGTTDPQKTAALGQLLAAHIVGR